MSNQRVIAILAVAVGLGWAEPSIAGTCVPGAQIGCACGGGRTGVQVCADSGDRFEPCKCEAAAQNAPEQQQPAIAAAGSIHIASDTPATVYIDGEDKGPAPFEAKNLKPGLYHVRVVRQDSTSEDYDVEVVAGEAQRIFVEVSPASLAALHRRGLKFGVGLGVGAWHVLDDIGDVGPVGNIGGFANFGITRILDFRLGLSGMIGKVRDYDLLTFVGVPISLRLNLGSVYTMWFGANLGMHLAQYKTQETTYCKTCSPRYWDVTHHNTRAGLSIAPELSFVTIRFGASRQFELSVVHGAAIPVYKYEGLELDDLMVLYNSVTFSMLFL